MAFFGFTLGGAGASGSVATAVAADAAAVDAAAAGAVAGGFAAGGGVVAGAFAAGAAGVSVDEVAAAGGAAVGAAAVVSPAVAAATEFPVRFRLASIRSPFHAHQDVTVQIRRRREIRPRAPRLPSIARSRRFQLGANMSSTKLPAAAAKSSL